MWPLPTRRGARPRTPGALLLASLLGLSCSVERHPPRQALVILVDTLRRDALGCYGHAGDPTPNIDALAAAGTRFEQAIASSGWTLPSIASILTASPPTLHKALGKKTRLTPITPDLPTAAELLREHGVATAAIANAAFLSPLLGLDRGFERFDHEPAFNDHIRRADQSVDLALALMEERQASEFFLLLHLFDPHLDYDAPDGFAEPFVGARREPAPPISMQDCLALQRAQGKLAPKAEDIAYVRGQYEAEVAFVDRALGRLFDGMRELGLFEDCLIVLVADHGEEFWEHRGLEHGHSLYDELVRVPLIVRGLDSGRQPLAVVESQVRTLDLMPTVLEHFGLAFPGSPEGRSLSPLIYGQDGTDRAAWIEGTLYGNDRSGLRGPRYKYILSQRADGQRGEELFDWRTDEGETRNLIESRPEQAAEMRAAYERTRTELEARAASLRAPEPEDINPETAAAVERSLNSLGYTGREEKQ